MKYMLSFIFLVSSLFSQTYHIAVNQAGYLINESKYAVINGEIEKLYLLNEKDEIVFENKTQLRTEKDLATGYKVYSFDFTNFNKSGKYYIGDNKGLKSYNFLIGESVFENLKRLSIKSFYYQRCDVEILEKHAGVFKHPSCHTSDAIFHTTAGTGSLNVNGGWHDAGDYGKYTVPASTTVGQMLMSYENYSENYQEDDLNIPESGNGIPDLLDEIKFELEWMLKMQREDGAVFWMVNSKTYHESMPHTSKLQRYIYEVSTMATGDFAAVMAMSARIYKKYDDKFAQICLSAALKAWDYLEKNSSMVPVNGYKNPSDSQAGGYSMNYDLDKRLWAAVELFRNNDDDKYHNFIKNNYSKGGFFNQIIGWSNIKSMALIEYLLIEDSKTDSNIRNSIKSELIKYSDNVVNIVKNDGYYVSLGSKEYGWGSNGFALNKAFVLLFAYKLTGNQNYYNVVLNQLNYVTGINAHNISFITGIGTNYCKNIHHAPSFSDKIAEPVPGFLAGGPEMYLSDPVLQKTFTRNTPPALCYVDNTESYASNEIAIYWNSSLVSIAGFFNKNLTSIENENKPQDIKTGFNYPNPFNSSTKISVKISKEDNIRLIVYNVLGSKVYEKEYGVLNPGYHILEWHGKDTSNQPVASGIYLFSVNGLKDKYCNNKILLLK